MNAIPVEAKERNHFVVIGECQIRSPRLRTLLVIRGLIHTRQGENACFESGTSLIV